MDISGFNEDIIIEGCRKNERRSQELLYRHFAKKMYSICLSYAGERPLAQDILQEAFIKVFKNIGIYRKSGSLEGWIRKIVTNTAIDHIRQRRPAGSFVDIDPGYFQVEVSNTVLSNIGFSEVMEQVNRLPDGARMVFNLHALEGFTHKEIAFKLDITEGTSKSQFNRARKLLLNFLGNLNM